MPRTWTWTPESPHSRADAELLQALEQGMGTWLGDPVTCSRSQLKRLMEEGQVTSRGKPVKPGAKLKPGEEIRIEFPEPRPLGVAAEDVPIDILFQDEHLLVVNKPPELTVHPSSTQPEGTLVNALLHHVETGKIGALSGIGGILRPGIVHRIDKDTSGALVITKSDVAHRTLVETFSRHEIERVYWAWVYGSPSPSQGRIESTLGRNPSDRKKMAMNVKHGRRAVTHYRRIEEYGVPKAKPFAAQMELRLETGRTHQIRVHLTGLGHSLLGDPAYGTPSERQPKWLAIPDAVRRAVADLPGQALHARVLGFRHPVTGESLRFEAPLPPALEKLASVVRTFL